MKAVIFRGFAPVAFSGAFGRLVLEGNGIINRVDARLWDAVYKEYKVSIDEFIQNGDLEIGTTKDFETRIDKEAKKDANKAVLEKQLQDQAEANQELAEKIKLLEAQLADVNANKKNEGDKADKKKG